MGRVFCEVWLMKAVHLLLTLLFGASVVSTSLAASYPHWRESVKAAEQARLKRDFQKQREILEGAAAEATELGPVTSARNSSILVETYIELRMFNEAKTLVDAELLKIGATPKDVNLRLARALLLYNSSRIEMSAKRFDTALQAANEATEIIEALLGKFHPEMFRMHMLIGWVHAESKNYLAAEKSFKTALKLAEAQNYVIGSEWSGSDEFTAVYRVKPPADGVVTAATALGDLYIEQNNFKEAEKFAKKALKDTEAVYGKKSPMILVPLDTVANVELKLGKRKEFERDCDRLFELASKSKGFDYWVANALWSRFGVELDENKNTSAVESARRIVVVYANQNFNSALLGKRALKDAVGTNATDWARLKTTMDIFGSALGVQFAAEPLKVGAFYMEFAKVANEGGPSDVALAAYEGFIKTQDTAPDKGALISVYSKIEEIRIASRDTARALETRRKVTALLRQKFGDDSRVADSLENEAAHLKTLGDEKGAAEAQAQAQANEVRKKALLKN